MRLVRCLTVAAILVLFSTISHGEDHDPGPELNIQNPAVRGHRILEDDRVYRLMQEQEASPSAIFERYKKKREALIMRLSKMVSEFEKLHFSGKPSPYQRAHIALAAELRRLKNEAPLLEKCAKDPKTLKERAPYFVESLVVMDFTEMMTAFGEQLNKLNREGKLTPAQMMVEAAEKLPQAYGKESRKSWAFSDPLLLRISTSAKAFKPHIEALLDSNDRNATAARLRFFSDYSARLSAMNTKELQQYRKEMEELSQKLQDIGK